MSSCRCRLSREQDLRALVLALVLDRLWCVALHIALVIVVARKQFLDTVSSELGFAFFDGLGVFPLLVVDVVRVEVVHVDVGHVLGVHLFGGQCVPVEVSEPRMSFQLVCASPVPNPVCWLSLQTFVYEVGSFFIPAIRDRSLFYRNLATENLISDVFSGASFVGTLAHHAFVGNDTDRKVICSQAVILTTHDFRGHVARSPTGFAGVVWGQDSGDSEVGQSEVAFIVKDEIFRLDVPVDNELGVDGLECVDEASNEKARDFHGELALAGDVETQVSPQEQVHHQVEVHGVLESVVHVNDELALDQGKQLKLIHHARHTLLSYDSRFSHLFHRILVAFVFLGLHAPNLAKSSATDGVHSLEVSLVGLRRAFFVFRSFEVTVAHSWFSVCRGE